MHQPSHLSVVQPIKYPTNQLIKAPTNQPFHQSIESLNNQYNIITHQILPHLLPIAHTPYISVDFLTVVWTVASLISCVVYLDAPAGIPYLSRGVPQIRLAASMSFHRRPIYHSITILQWRPIYIHCTVVSVWLPLCHSIFGIRRFCSPFLGRRGVLRTCPWCSASWRCEASC